MGGSTLSSSSGSAAPAEIQPLVPLQQASSKAAAAMSGTQEATAEYERLMDGSVEPPSAPVYAARLSALLKKLASAEGAVKESMKARRELVTGIEKLLRTNEEFLEIEKARHQDLSSKMEAVESRKRAVEDEILRKLPSESPYPAPANGNSTTLTNGQREESVELERPQTEELTPPPAPESPDPPSEDFEPAEPGEEGFGGFGGGTPTPPVGLDFGLPEDNASDIADEPSSKKRKLDGGFAGFMADGSRGLEDDVDALIRAESGVN